MSSIRSQYFASLFLVERRAAQPRFNSVEEQALQFRAENLSIDTLLLAGECRQELEDLLKGLISQLRPQTPAERELVFRILGASWGLQRLEHTWPDRETARRREQLIWSWHQALTQLRLLRGAPTAGPRPPAASRLALITDQDAADPVTPDRRRPHEPALPTWLPEAA